MPQLKDKPVDFKLGHYLFLCSLDRHPPSVVIFQRGFDSSLDLVLYSRVAKIVHANNGFRHALSP